MALEIIDNQLVKLFSVEDFNERNKRLTQDQRNYCQIVRPDQITMFQVRTTPETGENIILNGDFSDNPITLAHWNITSGFWAPDIGRAYGAAIGVGFAGINQTVAVSQNSYYFIEFNIDSMSDGQVLVAVSPTPDYGNFAALGVTEYGTYRFYFYSGLSTSATITINISGENDYAYIDYVNMVKYTTPIVTIEDCNGVTKRTLTPYAREEDRINYLIEWYGLPEACYRVCLTGVDDLTFNYLELALTLATEGGNPLLTEEGGFIKWFG